MIDVVALGELLIDFTCTGLDEQGYPAMQAHPGGAPANYLAALSTLGVKTALLAKVGDDAFGKKLIATLDQAGINTTGVLADGGLFTTLAFVTLDEKGEREFSFARKPGADTQLRFGELKLDLIDRARVFHFGTLSLTDEPARSATCRAVEYAKHRGKLISFDPNYRAPLWKSREEALRQMSWGLGQADVVKLSREEAELLFGLDPEQSALRLLEEFGVKLVFITCGAEGCYFSSGRGSGWVKALEGITPVDTTGAGDIFGGAAMAMLLREGAAPWELDELTLRRITEFACICAGLSTTRPGGISSVPKPEEIQRYL